MEALGANISSTCPMPFAGITGDLFLKAVTAVVAAHCSILDDYTWPQDNAEKVIEMGSSTSYDFIIVGAGTAGSLLASRLSYIYPSWSILLIEAGDDPGIDSEIPAFLFLNQNSNNDWFYKTQPDGQSCLGFRNTSCIWSKGKGMGGSSSINAMIYLRGHPEDFSYWANIGNYGWANDDLVKYFEEQEEFFNITDSAFPGYENQWYDILDSAWKELGFQAHNYINHETVIGTKRARILTQNGKRMNTAKTYFKNACNLIVMKNTIVEKVIINKKTNQALGVQIQHKSGIKMEISAKREVLLAAGSIATPQLLMLSGIGPKNHLEAMNINCIVNLPVGKNLQDHLFFPLFFKTKINQQLPSDLINILLLQYMLTRTGPFSNIGLTDYMSFISTHNNSEYPDIQFHYTYFTKNDNFVLQPYLEGVGYNTEVIKSIEALNHEHDLLGVYPTLLHPKSRGEILIEKSDLSKPIIKANYLQHPDDLNSLLKAINFVHNLEKTDTFKALGIELLNVKIHSCNKYSFNTDAYWECYIRHMATTIYHPVGTAKMGPEHDDTSVVGSNLIVHNTRNLRIVDASIMPVIPRANTMAATLAIAQKAVDIIREQYSSKDEL
ncbi:glucose dehydrogenase [FAD, quinone]-like [Pararge aegeria]|uniref:Jg24313 protein n=1 Tax=Pararge aegeria aegeria TaxID=348720 RepID=A0A8S4SDW7_9NEOP|nr:glucose dehydrogenase [FAD, quinone]-like [Pararge aegeria]CAH2259727.1 jg24313 [Pararge aegeria aegeria]